MRRELFHLHAGIEDRHWWFVGRRRIAAAVLERFLPACSQSLIIEVGCGTGGNLRPLSSRYTCIGIDPCEEAVRLARQKVSRATIIQGFAPQALEDFAERADAFLLLDVLEHVEDDAGLLARLVAVAKVGALFLITVPANPGLWSRHDEVFGHYRRYDRTELERLWAHLPVRVELLSYYNSRLYPLIWTIRKWNRMRRGTWGRDATDFSLPPKWINALLGAILAGELKTVLQSSPVEGGRGYRRGTSLIALLRRAPDSVSAADHRADVADPSIPHNGQHVSAT